MKILIPKQDESGNALSLKKFQEHSIRDILHTLDHGAVTGTGTARGALLGDTMGAGKTIQAIAVVNTVPEVPPRPSNLHGIGSREGLGRTHSSLADP